ncbi:hypothetical protein ES703_100624 [subsurface metagenome]
MAGRAISPIVTVATPLTPTIAANIVQTSTVPMAKPPFTRPSHRCIAWNISSAMPERCNIDPIMRNRIPAMKMGVVQFSKAT